VRRHAASGSGRSARRRGRRCAATSRRSREPKANYSPSALFRRPDSPVTQKATHDPQPSAGACPLHMVTPGQTPPPDVHLLHHNARSRGLCLRMADWIVAVARRDGSARGSTTTPGTRHNRLQLHSFSGARGVGGLPACGQRLTDSVSFWNLGHSSSDGACGSLPQLRFPAAVASGNGPPQQARLQLSPAASGRPWED
jgi:hypothetical protein